MYWMMDAEHPASSIYFICIVLLCNFLVLNMSVSVLVAVFSAYWSDYKAHQDWRRQLRRNLISNINRVRLGLVLSKGGSGASADPGDAAKPKDARTLASSFMRQQVKARDETAVPINLDNAALDDLIDEELNEDGSVKRKRPLCLPVVESRWFQWTALVLILLNVVVLSFPKDTLGLAGDILEICFVFLFSIEVRLTWRLLNSIDVNCPSSLLLLWPTSSVGHSTDCPPLVFLQLPSQFPGFHHHHLGHCEFTLCIL